MGMRYIKPQVIIAQDELPHADAEASPVARQRVQLGRDAATRGEPYLIRRRIEPEGVAAIGDRLRRYDGPIDDEMEVGVGSGRMAERSGPFEYPGTDRTEFRHPRLQPREAIAKRSPCIVRVKRGEFMGVVKALPVVALDIAFGLRALCQNHLVRLEFEMEILDLVDRACLQDGQR